MKALLIVTAALLFISPANACTTFLINSNGQLVFGRNYDWITGSGMVCTNQRGVQKQSWKTQEGSQTAWTSVYGSISFNQYGKEFPIGGMNEKGLVVELMWLSETSYPKSDRRAALNSLQWIQYQLDCSATIEDVIASDKKVRITNTGTSPLHFLVADGRGNAATIEFIDGKLLAHKGNRLPLPVLTNSPYEDAIQWKTAVEKNNDIADLAFANNSIERFSTACSMVSAYQSGDIRVPVIDYAFDVLDRVKQNGFTQWSIVYDISKRQIFFKSMNFKTVKSIRFSSFDFSCKTIPQIFEINQDRTGDVAALFKPLTVAINRKILDVSAKESESKFIYTEERKAEISQYPTGMSCSNF